MVSQKFYLDEKATLFYYDNLTPDSSEWKRAQLKGLAGKNHNSSY